MPTPTLRHAPCPSVVRAAIAVILSSCALAGCRALEGSATGTCRARHAAREDGRPVAREEARARVAVVVRRGERGLIRLRMEGCDQFLRETPPAPHTNPHFVVVHGSLCAWSLPGLGSRTLAVADRPAPTEITDGVSYEAYANFADREILVVFEAPVYGGQARFQSLVGRPHAASRGCRTFCRDVRSPPSSPGTAHPPREPQRRTERA